MIKYKLSSSLVERFYHVLPKSLKEINKDVSIENILKLVNIYGGTTLYDYNDNRLTNILGKKLANKLVKKVYYVPNCTHVKYIARYYNMYNMHFNEKKETKQIADLFNVTERTVWKAYKYVRRFMINHNAVTYDP